MHTKVVSCASKNPLKSKSKEMKTLGSSNEGEDVLGQCSSNLSLNAKWGDSTFLALRRLWKAPSQALWMERRNFVRMLLEHPT
jgi:hypothetical protein